MIYNQTLDSPDEIEVMTYYKCPVQVMLNGPSLKNIIVTAINGSNCTYKLGENDTEKTIAKSALFELINFNCFSCGN